MPKRRSSSVLFFTFAAVAVASTAVSLVRAGVGERAHAKFEHEKHRAETRCARMTPSSDPWCGREAVPVFAKLREGRDDVAAAKHARAIGDRAAAGRAVVRALDRVTVLEGSHSFVGSLAAATLTGDALDVLDSDAALREDADVKRALHRTRLPSGAQPFARLRDESLAALAAMPGSGHIPDVPLARAGAGIAMERVERTLGEMEAATLAGDVKGCERAVSEADPLVRSVVMGPAVCTSASRLVGTGARLRAMSPRLKGSDRPTPSPSP